MKPITLITPLIALSLALTVSSVRAQGLGALVSPAPEETTTDEDAKTEETPEPKPVKAPTKPSPKPEASAPQPTASVAKPASSPAPAATAKPPVVAQTNTVQKIPAAGIQFEVPKGWQITEVPGPNDIPNYRMVSKDGAGYALIPTSETNLSEQLSAMRSAVEKKGKNFKAGEEKQATVNGMKCVFRADTVDDGASVSTVGYVQAKIPVVFMRAGDAAVMKANAATLDGIFHSLKKSE